MALIGQIFGIDRTVSSNHSFGVNAYIHDCEISPQETRDIVLWCSFGEVQRTFRYPVYWIV